MPLFRDLPIKRKLTAIVMLACVPVLFLTSGYFISKRIMTYREDLVHGVLTLARVVGINSTAALIFQDPGTAHETLSALSAEPYIEAACIFTADGELFATYQRPRDPGSLESTDIDFNDPATWTGLLAFSRSHDDEYEFKAKSFVLAHPIYLKGKIIGRVYILADLTGFHSSLLWYAVIAGLVVLAAVLLVFFLSWKLQKLISRPILALARTAGKISREQNFTIRAEKYGEDEIGDLIDGFNEMLQQIQHRDDQLEKHREHLEEQVKARTGELADAIEELELEIVERKRAEGERERMASELHRAQKMEAIGTLAGGVAHDLNNILSGILSYPELLLLDIPEDNPMRKPMETIQSSGQKAAAIVQDLLTLARRGVSVTEVVDVKKLLKDYMDSPEFAKLQYHHPQVELQVSSDDDLLNIEGSPVHLFKTIMNLISNAAEAMPEGGKITVSAYNQYVDKPLPGYVTVEEGDYMALSVMDTGVGIAPVDLERIFEPFYTKKVMGRSGTGLGMAVVWGAVQDHNGYIDVHSAEGRGSTFKLYFPATRKKVRVEAAPSNVTALTGNGEHVLVVDDVKEQREIAAKMLEKLGYVVDVVESGEDAVAYIENNPVDLMILDMIMDPGIDGFETFKRIHEFNPLQRAIIASGFSESERVKAAQSLGAGQYVKKPYTLDRIGTAVREELDKP
ncbi:MAG: response regulator [Desulfobacterales bacterium]|nr:response regulator [Desulfobacterales bacterium]